MAPNQDLRKKGDANPVETAGEDEEEEEEEEPDKAAREPRRMLPRGVAAKYVHPDPAVVLCCLLTLNQHFPLQILSEVILKGEEPSLRALDRNVITPGKIPSVVASYV